MQTMAATRPDGTGGGKTLLQWKAPKSPLPPVVVPAGARKCHKCGILMPITGISAISQAEPTKCTECAGEGPAPTLVDLHVESYLAAHSRPKEEPVAVNRDPRKYDTLTEADVARWAALRREGRSYTWIEEHDELHPSDYALVKYLEKYGYARDGQRVKDQPSAKKAEPATLATTEPALPTTSGHGDVTHQLAALQQLMSTLEASDVRLSGRIRVELMAEIAL